jgi:large subunit ribosomal protein L16
MLQPKKRKHKKEFRGNNRGFATSGSRLAYGDLGIQATDSGWITSNQIESARKAIVRETKRKGKTWLRIFPHKPITKKSDEVKRGGGKGEVNGYVAVIRRGTIIFELGGLEADVATKALKLAAQKLAIKTRVVTNG